MMFPDSGLVVGPSHSDGGVYASVANGPDVELEGGEFIINKEATEDFLPLIKQINDIGRMEQMDNTDNAQNAHSAIDALIANASTQMMPGGGMVSPKTPMYQEGGQTESLLDILNQLQSSRQKYQGEVLTESGQPRFGPEGRRTKAGFAEKFNFPLEEAVFDTLIDTPSQYSYNINLPNDETIKVQSSQYGGMTDKKSEMLGKQREIQQSLRKAFPEESSQLTFKMDSPSDAIRAVQRGYLNMDPFEQMKYDRGEKERNNLKSRLMKSFPDASEAFVDSFLTEKGYRQGGMIQYEEGGPLHSRRMFNQGTGFDKKKSDLDNDGKISEYEKKRGMAIAKSMNRMQEGGAVADRTRVAQNFIPTESLNLPLVNLLNPRQAGSVSRAPMTNEEIMQIVMDVATPGAVMGSIGKKKLLPFEDSTVDYFDRVSDYMKRFGSYRDDAVEEIRSMDMRDRIRKRLRGRKPKETEGPKILENLYDKSGFHVQGYEDKFLQFPKYVFKSDKSILERMDLLNESIKSYERYQKTIGPSKSINMRLFGDRKKLQALEDFYTSPGKPQVKTVEGDFKDLDLKQQGGMIGMQQPMMQRPMNPAMNLSPMQRMGNDMPPMMYQEGGAVADKTRVELPSQIVLDNLARRIGSSSDIQTPNDLVRYLTTVRPAFEVSSPEDNENIENFFKMLESIDAVPKSRKSMQMGGQIQLRKQAEMKRSKTPELNILFPDLTPSSPPDISGFNEPNISETPMRLLIDTGKVKKEVGDINRSKGFKNAINYNALLEELDKYFPKNLSKAQEGGMISNNNLMGAMANDRRVAALQPDVYSSKMENGMTVEQKMMVPKLAEAVLPVYGVETPLSKRQSSMLKKNAVSPSALNPNVKGLVNRLLVQRLANETT